MTQLKSILPLTLLFLLIYPIQVLSQNTDKKTLAMNIWLCENEVSKKEILQEDTLFFRAINHTEDFHLDSGALILYFHLGKTKYISCNHCYKTQRPYSFEERTNVDSTYTRTMQSIFLMGKWFYRKRNAKLILCGVELMRYRKTKMRWRYTAIYYFNIIELSENRLVLIKN